MIWYFLVPTFILVYFLIGAFLAGVAFRIDSTEATNYDPRTDDGLSIILAVAWPVLLVALILMGLWKFILQPIGSRVSILNPIVIYAKVFHFGMSGNPWKSWKDYVLKRSS